jgi:Mn-dependent DtxR family transcriptional regulator
MSLLSTLRQTVAKNWNHHSETQFDFEPQIAYEILRNRRRRHILQYIASRDTTVSVGDIADHLAHYHDEDRTAVYVASIQNHLPKLDQAGICDYDENRKLIELTPRGRAVVEIHQTVEESLNKR